MLQIPRWISRIPLVRGVARLGITAYARLLKRRYLIDRRMGLLLMLDQTNVIDWQLLISGTWERPQLDRLFGLTSEQLRKRPDRAVFLDVGAHWGWCALLAHQSGLFDRIIAIEPDPMSYGQLQANLVLNDLAGEIEAIRAAASDRRRSFALTQRNPRNRGATRVAEPDERHPAVVQGHRLDELFQFDDRLLVIKIDVEGHELEAIHGMRNLVANNACIIQIEVWDDLRRGPVDQLQVVSRLLEQWGVRQHSEIQPDYFFVSKSPSGG